MKARLVQLEAERDGAVIALAEELLIGRDPTADLPLPFPRVSRRHARLLAGRDGYTIEDLASANGTRVNDQPVTGPVLLASGDRIQLGGEVTLRYEEIGGGSAPTLVAVGLGLVLAVLLGTGTWWALGGRAGDDPVLTSATEIARQGLDAWQRGDAREAKAKLQGAVGILFREGYLDDVQRLQATRVGLQRLGHRIGPEVDLVAVFQDALSGTQPRAEAPAAAKRSGRCRLESVDARRLDGCVREWSEQVLRELRQDPASVPDSFYAAVHEQLLHLSRRREFMEGSLARGRPFVPMMRREFEQAKMPPILHYLSLIESGYRSEIRSKAGARGLWQFMPGTARQYGLEVKGAVDQRTDPELATRAAARYLRDLAFEFGGDALLLAIASYNKGENGVRRALKRLDDPFSDRSYWRLVEHDLLPQETQEYVPRLIASAVLGEGGIPPSRVVAAASR